MSSTRVVPGHTGWVWMRRALGVGESSGMDYS